jgi:hypothetical protein
MRGREPARLKTVLPAPGYARRARGGGGATSRYTTSTSEALMQRPVYSPPAMGNKMCLDDAARRRYLSRCATLTGHRGASTPETRTARLPKAGLESS